MSVEIFPRKEVPIYPIAKNGKQCIGPCYPANKSYAHPDTNRFIRDDFPSCPIAPTPIIVDGRTTINLSTECYYKKGSDKELPTNIDLGINLQYSQFLKLYYKIYDFEGALAWIDKHKMVTTITKERIIDSAITTFKDSIQVIDDMLVNLYLTIIKDLWFDALYRLLNEFIIIDKDHVLFKDITEEDIARKKIKLLDQIVLANDPDASIKVEFITKKFLTASFVYRFLKKIIIKTEGDVNIKKSFIMYVLSKLPIKEV